MAVRVKLPTIKDREKKAKNIDKILFQVGGRLQLLLENNWDKGLGSDGKKLPALTKAYEKKKSASGRKGVRTFSFSGLMRQGLFLARVSRSKLRLKFVNSQIPKARGNVKYAQNMMVPISDKIDRKLQKLAFKLWTQD